MPKSFSDGFFEDRGWLGIVQSDQSTGILSVGGSSLVEASVTTMTDLLALNTTTYDGQKIIVTNPAGMVSGYSPAEFYCTQAAFKMLGGNTTLVDLVPRRRVTWPVAAWSAGAMTLTSAAAGAHTKIAGAAAHGLTTAKQVTAGDTYVYVSGGTGWTVGLTKIISIDAVNDLTLDHPYSVGLGTPTITGDTAGTASEIPIQTIKIPRLSTQYLGSFEIECMYKNYTTTATRTLIRYGSSGLAVGGGVAVFNLNDSSASLCNVKTKVRNTGLAGKSISTSTAVSSTSGFSTTAAASPLATDIDNTSVTTDILITAYCNSTGADRTQELISACGLWRY